MLSVAWLTGNSEDWFRLFNFLKSSCSIPVVNIESYNVHLFFNKHCKDEVLMTVWYLVMLPIFVCACRRMLSMYASVTNIIPDLDDHSKISGRILYITIDSHGFPFVLFFYCVEILSSYRVPFFQVQCCLLIVEGCLSLILVIDIVHRDNKAAEKFEFDPTKISSFEICQSIWEMINKQQMFGYLQLACLNASFCDILGHLFCRRWSSFVECIWLSSLQMWWCSCEALHSSVWMFTFVAAMKCDGLWTLFPCYSIHYQKRLIFFSKERRKGECWYDFSGWKLRNHSTWSGTLLNAFSLSFICLQNH